MIVTGKYSCDVSTDIRIGGPCQSSIKGVFQGNGMRNSGDSAEIKSDQGREEGGGNIWFPQGGAQYAKWI